MRDQQGRVVGDPDTRATLPADVPCANRKQWRHGIATSLQIALAVHCPIYVDAIGRGVRHQDAGVTIAEFDVLPLSAAQFPNPAADFRMAIQESETTGAVVVGGGNIAPTVGASEAYQCRDEIAVVN